MYPDNLCIVNVYTFHKNGRNAFPHNHLEITYGGKQSLIRNDLTLYIFHMQVEIEIPKALKFMTVMVDIV